MKSEQITVVSENPLKKKKTDTVIEKNTGFETLKIISNILRGNETSRDNTISEQLTADDMAHMKVAPMYSVDVNSLKMYIIKQFFFFLMFKIIFRAFFL